MRRGWIIGGLGAALLAAVLLVPAATGANGTERFHKGGGTTSYVSKINGSTAPTLQCSVAGVFLATITARVDTPNSGSLTTDQHTDQIRVTVSSPASGEIIITAPNTDVSGPFSLPCPLPQQSTQVTFTFTPQRCQPRPCSNQTGLTPGSVTLTITNSASA